MPSSHRSMSDETRAEISPHRRSLAGRFLGRWGGCSDLDPSGGHQDPETSDFAGGAGVETAVRTTGLLTAGRNPGDRTDPSCQTLTTKATTLLSKGNYPPSAGLQLRSPPLGGCFSLP